ncbi:MAG: PP2C family protein-serine/threonine phosphatase, partial [Candidatus Thermoplasmatota archaeon]
PEAALPRAFRAFDETVAAEPSGAVAVVAVVLGPSLAVANAGDSHAIIVSPSRTGRLTTDHRLTNEAEFRRVVAAGARVWGPYACLPDGTGLMCTRSLGDRAYRGIGIIPEPEVRTRILAAEEEWIIAATDGVWDGMEPAAVGHLARTASTAKEAAEAIRDAAVEASGDNVTVVAVRRQAF